MPRLALLTAVCAAGLAAGPLRLTGVGLEYLPGDRVDNRLNNFVMEHGFRYLSGKEPRFWDAPLCWPARRTVAYSDAHLGTLPIYAGCRVLGASQERAFQLAWLASFALNFASAAWAAGRFGHGACGSAAAAFVFAFGLPSVAEWGHAQLAPRWLVPVAAVFGWRYLRGPSAGRLARLAAAVAGQAVLGVYVGYFLVLWLVGLAVVAGLVGLIPWRAHLRPGRSEGLRRIGVLLFTGLCLVPLILPYWRARRDYEPTPTAELKRFFATPASWATPPGLSLHARWMPSPEAADERRLFPGFAPVAAVLSGLGALVRRGKAAGPGAVMAASAVVVMLLTVRVGEHSAYDIVLGLPGAGSVRAVSRVALVLLFPLGLAVAALAGAGRLAPLLLALVALDQSLGGADFDHYRTPVAEAQAARAKLAAAFRDSGAAVVFVFAPRPETAGAGNADLLALQVEAMLAAQEVGAKCVNGWTGYRPRGWYPFHDYGGLGHWLLVTCRLSESDLAGLRVFGAPAPPSTGGERELARRYPALELP